MRDFEWKRSFEGMEVEWMFERIRMKGKNKNEVKELLSTK